MEMAFMEQQVQYLNKMKVIKLFFIFIFILLSCNKKDLVIDASENVSSIVLKNRLLYFKGKLLSGEIIAFYDADKTIRKSSCFYLKGQKNGAEKKWHSNGQISSSRMYLKNVKVGSHKAWWSNGEKKFEYVFNDEGAYFGTLKEWFENGQLYREFNYVNGQEEGSQKMWKQNGNIRANYVVKNGERFGLIGMKKCDPVSVN
jgi:antitoxin component YwqK of YwqJK toxin-antitoxin module